MPQRQFAEVIYRLPALFGPKPDVFLLRRSFGRLHSVSISDGLLPISVLGSCSRPVKHVKDPFVDQASLGVFHERGD